MPAQSVHQVDLHPINNPCFSTTVVQAAALQMCTVAQPRLLQLTSRKLSLFTHAPPCKKMISSRGELATNCSRESQALASKNAPRSTNTCLALTRSPSCRILAVVPMHSFVLMRNTLVSLPLTQCKFMSLGRTCLCLH